MLLDDVLEVAENDLLLFATELLLEYIKLVLDGQNEFREWYVQVQFWFVEVVCQGGERLFEDVYLEGGVQQMAVFYLFQFFPFLSGLNTFILTLLWLEVRQIFLRKQEKEPRAVDVGLFLNKLVQNFLIINKLLVDSIHISQLVLEDFYNQKVELDCVEAVQWFDEIVHFF